MHPPSPALLKGLNLYDGREQPGLDGGRHVPVGQADTQTERPASASGSGSGPPWLPGEPSAQRGSGQDSPDPPGFLDTWVTVTEPQGHQGAHISTSWPGLPSTQSQ